MDLRCKLARIGRLSRPLGLARAARLELEWSIRKALARSARGVAPRKVRVRVPALGRMVTIRCDDSDLEVFEQVFVQNECDLPAASEPRVVVDAGANVGYTTALFATRYPSAKVIAIEPSPENCEIIRENCLGLDNVVLVCGALWPESGWVRIVNPGADSWAFHVEACTEGAPGAVRAYSVPDVLAAAGAPGAAIGIMKIDIENAETELFSRHTEEWLPSVGTMSIEIHSPAAEAAVRRAIAGTGFSEARSGEKVVLTQSLASHVSLVA